MLLELAFPFISLSRSLSLSFFHTVIVSLIRSPETKGQRQKAEHFNGVVLFIFYFVNLRDSQETRFYFVNLLNNEPKVVLNYLIDDKLLHLLLTHNDNAV